MLLNLTFICIEDWKRSPEPQYNVNFKKIVDGDTDDKDNHHATKHASRKYDVGICRDKCDRYQTYSFRLCVSVCQRSYYY